MNQNIQPTLTRVNPPQLFDGAAFGMSQATVDTASGLVFVSGQVAWDAQGRVCGEGYGPQTVRALENVRRALTAANATVDSIIRMRIYVRGEVEEHLAQMLPHLLEFLGDGRPAMTGIGVASLANPATLVEIEVVARASPGA